MRVLAAAIVALLPLQALAEGPFGKIVVGNWSGGAFTNDSTGAFSHCAVTAPYKNGVRMLTSVTSQFNWLLGFSKPSWQLTPGTKLSLRMVFDRSSSLEVTADVRRRNLITIAMPANSELTNAFRRGRYLELVANNARLVFTLTSTSEMLPALVECVRQSANLRGPIRRSPNGADPPAAPTEAELKQRTEKKELLEKSRDLIRSRMLACIGREGATMILTDEKAEVVAKAAMIFCKNDVDALVRATIEIIENEDGRPANRQAIRDAAEKRVHEVIMAQIVRSRGELLNRQNRPPQQPAPPPVSPTL